MVPPLSFLTLACSSSSCLSPTWAAIFSLFSLPPMTLFSSYSFLPISLGSSPSSSPPLYFLSLDSSSTSLGLGLSTSIASDPSLGRLFLLVLHFRRSSTPGNNIDDWDRSLLHSNQLNILSRGTISFLNLGYQLQALLNHMVDSSAILTCRSWVLTVSS